LSKYKLYSISALCLLAGYSYLAYSMVYDTHLFTGGHTLCLFKNVTGLPCPSCGATRSMACLLHGHLLQALYWNPIGILLMAAMVVIPLLLLYDLLKGQSVYLNLYTSAEQFIIKKPIVYVAVALMVINWLWNINKGL